MSQHCTLVIRSPFYPIFLYFSLLLCPQKAQPRLGLLVVVSQRCPCSLTHLNICFLVDDAFWES